MGKGSTSPLFSSAASLPLSDDRPARSASVAAHRLRYTREIGASNISGWLVKEGKTMKKRKLRFLVLDGSNLSNHKETGSAATWTASIKDCAVGPGTRKNELVVNLPTRKVSFFVATAEDFERWIFALKKASSSNFNLDAFYKVGDCIGVGVNGEVHIGWDRATNEAVAIKSIPYEGDMSAADDKEAEAEIDIVKSLNHPALVKTYDVFRDRAKKRVYMVMEYVRGGELFARVANEAGSLVTEIDSRRIAKDLLEAVVYMHRLGIVHRDIKLENILCLSEDTNKPIRVKLADFGLSAPCLGGKDATMSSLVG
jgi:Protein kinase domain/PH domain